MLWLATAVVVVAAAAIAVVMTGSRDDRSESQAAANQASVAAAAPADAAGVAAEVTARNDASVIDAFQPGRAADVEIRVTTVPSGAEIAVDGVVMGVSPLTVRVASTSTNATVTATLAGHDRAEQKVGVSSDTGSVAITLQRQQPAVSAEKEKPRSRPNQRARSSEPSNTQKKPAANSPAYNPDDVGGD